MKESDQLLVRKTRQMILQRKIRPKQIERTLNILQPVYLLAKEKH
jgi:hypothetical protein